MGLNKKTVIISAALLAAIVAVYPLYRAAQRAAEQRDAGFPSDAPAGNSAAVPNNNSGQYLFDGPVEGGLTASGRAMTAPDSAADKGPGTGLEPATRQQRYGDKGPAAD